MSAYAITGRSISIHAPREGSDVLAPPVCLGERGISIHAPREGSDLCRPARPGIRPTFLSTLPARGATRPGSRSGSRSSRFLSTLPARGATTRPWNHFARYPFLSTLPARGATRIVSCRAIFQLHFYPRSPRGERRIWPGSCPRICCIFLSTLPARGATGLLR